MISGTVSRHTGTPLVNVSNASVQAVRTAPSALTIAQATINTTNGTYRIFGAPAGTYNLTATVPSSQGGTSITTVVPATVVAGQETERDITMVGLGSVSGTLTLFNGSPAVTRSVSLLATGFNRSRTTDTSGAFTFTEVPIGTYTLSATDSVTNYATTAVVVVAADQTTVQNLVYLGVSTVSGTVRDGAGNTVPAGTIVTLVPQPSGSSRNDATDASGVYPFPNVVAGTYLVRTTDPVSSIISSATITVVPPTPVMQDLQYVSTGTVTGRVQAAERAGVGVDGAAIPRAAGDADVHRTVSSNAALGSSRSLAILPGATTT